LARLARIDPQLLYPVKHRSARAQPDLRTQPERGVTLVLAHCNGFIIGKSVEPVVPVT